MNFINQKIIVGFLSVVLPFAALKAMQQVVVSQAVPPKQTAINCCIFLCLKNEERCAANICCGILMIENNRERYIANFCCCPCTINKSEKTKNAPQPLAMS